MTDIRNRSKLPIYKTLILFISVVFLLVCLHPSKSIAFLGTQDATHCHVFAPSSTNYFDPQVALYCESDWGFLGTESDTEYLGINECEDLWYFWLGVPARVCARVAPPGENGNPSIGQGNPRPMLCVYDDPIDPNDWEGGSGPFHTKTSRQDAMTAEQGAKMGVLVVSGPIGWVGQLGVGGTAGDVMMYMGAGMGGIAMTGIAAGIGAAVAAIMGEYNHWVLEDKGCVDIPLGPIPDEFCNDCWEIKRTPAPRVELDDTATFEETKIKVTVCKNPTTNKTKRCPTEGAILAGEIGEQFIITPRPPAFNACQQINDNASYLLGENPTFSPSYFANNPEDQRVICAQISRTRNTKVCVYQEVVDPQTLQTVRTLLKCFDRPDFMPAPTVNNNASTFTNPNITVVLGTGTFQQQATLTVDPGTYISSIPPDPTWTANCAYVNQIEFCAYRPCTTYAADGKTCLVVSPQICVEGYKTPPKVVAKISDNKIVKSLPNVQRVATASALPGIWEYRPLVNPATPTDIANFTQEVCNYYAANPSNKCPRTCYATNYKNGDGKSCINQDGACESTTYPDMINGICYNYKASLATDVHHFDDTVYYIRPSTPEELDLCVGIPPPEDDDVYATAGTYNYTVPVNCNALRVKMYGGGGRGHASGGGDKWDAAGGSGGYGEWEVRVNPGDVHNLHVGAGSRACSGGSLNGEASYFRHTDWVHYLLAHGGTEIAGGWGEGQGGDIVRNWNSTANYIELPGTRRGINGAHSGSCAKGPSGGLVCGQCWNHCARPPHAPRTMNPDIPTQPMDAPNPPDYTYQPGAGGCSYDDPGHEPWGEGGEGEVRLNCFGRIGDMPPRYGLRLWLDAQEVNGAGAAVPVADGPIGTWVDKSLNKKKLTQTDVNRQPSYISNVQNGRPVIRFNGYPKNNSAANDYDYLRMSPYNLALNTGLTAFVVGRHNDIGEPITANFFLGFENGWSRFRIAESTFQSNLGLVSYTGFPYGVFKILTVKATTSGSVDVYINGNSKVSGGTLASGQFAQNSDFWVGGAETAGHFSLNGDIAEIIMYGYPLTITEQRDIEDYLSTKWDITDVTPASIAGLRLWLDGQDPNGDDNVAALPADGPLHFWKDKSSNHWDATIGTTSPSRPGYKSSGVINGYGGYWFDADDYLDLPDGTLPTGNSAYSLSAVVKTPPTIGNQGFLGSGYGVTDHSLAFRVNGSWGASGTIHHYWWWNDITSVQTINASTPYLLSFTYNTTPGVGRRIYINGVLDTATNTNTNRIGDGTNCTIGKTVANEYWGLGYTDFATSAAIGEIQLYGTTLTAQELRWVELYLSGKWGITIP